MEAISVNERPRMDVPTKVKSIIAESLGRDLDEIDDETRMSDYGFESLDLMQLEFQLNNEFNLTFNSDLDVDDDTTVKDVVEFVSSSINQSTKK